MKTGMRILMTVLAGVGMAMTANRAYALTTLLPAYIPATDTASLAAFGVTTSDSGTLQVKLTTPNVNASIPVTSPFGTPPYPSVTPVTAGWQLTFTPSVGFLATASIPTQTTIMDGKLIFYVTFATPIEMTANLYENGTWYKTGSGSVSSVGTVTVTPVDSNNQVLTDHQLINTATVAPTVSNQSAPWSAYTQVTGFQQSYTTYQIKIENVLTAKVGTTAGNSWISKSNLTLILTNDGSTGGGHLVPEPASLSVLALGSLALLKRRRRA